MSSSAAGALGSLLAKSSARHRKPLECQKGLKRSRVWGFGFRVRGLGGRVLGLGFGVSGGKG